jgi:hypothetical protein
MVERVAGGRGQFSSGCETDAFPVPGRALMGAELLLLQRRGSYELTGDLPPLAFPEPRPARWPGGPTPATVKQSRVRRRRARAPL